MRSAISTTSRSEVRSSNRNVNSSPPNRATVSIGRSIVLQPLAERRQQPVAGGVTERVVDLLEVVEVEEQDRELRRPSAGRARARRRGGRGTAHGWGGRSAGRAAPGGRARASERLRSIAWTSVRRSTAGASSDLTRQSWAPALTASQRERLVVAVGQQHDRRLGRGQPHVLEQVDRLLVRVGADVEQHAAGRDSRRAPARPPRRTRRARTRCTSTHVARSSSSISRAVAGRRTTSRTRIGSGVHRILPCDEAPVSSNSSTSVIQPAHLKYGSLPKKLLDQP